MDIYCISFDSSLFFIAMGAVVGLEVALEAELRFASVLAFCMGKIENYSCCKSLRG